MIILKKVGYVRKAGQSELVQSKEYDKILLIKSKSVFSPMNIKISG